MAFFIKYPRLPHLPILSHHFLTLCLVGGENRDDGKQREENMVKNSVFRCLAKEGKWGGRKTQEKVFSTRPIIFILPNQEEKAGEKSALPALLYKYPVLESS